MASNQKENIDELQKFVFLFEPMNFDFEYFDAFDTGICSNFKL